MAWDQEIFADVGNVSTRDVPFLHLVLMFLMFSNTDTIWSITNMNFRLQSNLMKKLQCQDRWGPWPCVALRQPCQLWAPETGWDHVSSNLHAGIYSTYSIYFLLWDLIFIVTWANHPKYYNTATRKTDIKLLLSYSVFFLILFSFALPCLLSESNTEQNDGEVNVVWFIYIWKGAGSFRKM